MGIRLPSSILAAAAAGIFTAPCPAQNAAPDVAAFRALYKQLVEINTTRSVGSCTQAAEAMRAHLLAAGIPAADTQILAPPDRPQDGALIAVLHGRDRAAKPILLLAHIDVVEAKREDWARDPFKLVEENGWFYGRGSSDDKAMAAVFTDSLVRYAQEGFKPRRDIKLALTCGEETAGVFNSVKWLTETQPKVLSAAFALNEGAGGELDKNGKPLALQIQAGEKVYQDFALEATDVGGHSSRPTKNNPIARLSAGLAKLGNYNFAVALNPATRGYFEAQSKLEPPEIAADMRAVLKNPQDEAAVERLWAVNPGWNGALRTTCVVTQIEGGHAPNALPQHVRANVNCRILPGVPIPRGAAGDRQSARRRQDQHCADRRSRNSVAAAASHGTHHGAGAQTRRRDMAGRRDRSDHVHRRHRRCLSERERRSDLWAVGHVSRRRGQPCARSERAHPREVADGWTPFPLRNREALRQWS